MTEKALTQKLEVVTSKLAYKQTHIALNLQKEHHRAKLHYIYKPVKFYPWIKLDHWKKKVKSEDKGECVLPMATVSSY